MTPGYKQSGLGLMPNDWHIRRLDACVEQQRPISYGIVQTGPNLRDGVPCLRVVDIDEGVINTLRLIRTSKQISDRYKRTVLKSGDLVMPLRGKVGDTGIVDCGLEGANLTRGVALLAVRRDLSASFIRYCLTSPRTRRRLEQSMNGSALQEIPIGTLRAFEIMMPASESEQRAIAEALTDAEVLQRQLGRLIAKMQATKQGIMQQLLCGRTRLPGFDDKWRATEVGELLEFKNGLNKGSQYFGSGTPIVNFMDVMRGPIITSGDVVGRVTLTREEIKRFSAKRGDIFFTRTSETIDEVGTAAVLVDEVPDAAFSGFILRGRPRTTDLEPRFLAHLFQLDKVRMQVTSTATYTTRALTNGRSLSRVSVELPSFDEQACNC